ncbi:MAG TPA: aa3-type cytochrome c oxidase subunit IV [Rhizomicrobium sp.]|nr:aa3-type cytochrome c oxidase subunit IV [Rhizomicrobium sp.]
MEETAHKTDQGSMDISDHVATWNGFLTLVKWVIIGNVILLASLAIFRTHG